MDNVIFLKRQKCIFTLITFFIISAPIYSQELIVNFGIGGHFLNYERIEIDDTTVGNGFSFGVNILFVGQSGFTISTGVNIPFFIGEGLNIDPVMGLGYLHYDIHGKYYIGGILNLVTKPYLRLFYNNNFDRPLGDVFITPTFVFGYNFGNFLIGGQLSYMFGITSGINGVHGFKFSLNIGLNVLENFRRK